ncbi:MAG: hypothetical protein K2W95_25755 [Candidatus Obscuribacterales bacterium]|nr:hypothetical protein [Candidatus Obscuribacterales bacterium]
MFKKETGKQWDETGEAMWTDFIVGQHKSSLGLTNVEMREVLIQQCTRLSPVRANLPTWNSRSTCTCSGTARAFSWRPRARDTRAIQTYLGHKNIQHTVLYTKLDAMRFKGFGKDLKF